MTALFRRPLGLPIPHTAVVPSNQARIGATLGRFFSTNFLSPRVAAQRLARVDLLGLLAERLENPDTRAAAAKWLAAAAPRAMNALPREGMSEFATLAARRGLEALPVAPLAGRVLAIVWAQGDAQPLIDRGLELAESALERHKPTITNAVAARTSRWIPEWVDGIIADRIVSWTSRRLRDMRAPDHPWRVEAHATIATFIDDLAHDPMMRARGDALKAEILASPAFEAQARMLWTQIRGSLRRGALSDPQALEAMFATALAAAARWLRADDARRARLNRGIRLLGLRAALPRRAEIGAYVAEVVERWDADTLVARLELFVGKDLQYIRINGTLVGGLVGLIIFSAARFLGV